MNRNQQKTFLKDPERNVAEPFRQTRLANLQALQLHGALRRYYPSLSITTSNGLASDLVLSAVNFSLPSAEKKIVDDLRQHVTDHLSKSQIQNDDKLYREIVTLACQEVWRKDEAFRKIYNAKINELTQQFFADFLTASNQIDWLKLVDFVSKREGSKMSPSSNT